MDTQTRKVLERPLTETSASKRTRKDMPATPLLVSASQLFDRAIHCADRELPGARLDRDALEAACLAIMFPLATETPKVSSVGVMSLAERCNLANELLFNLGAQISEDLIERTAEILADCPRKTAQSSEARVLADTINIEDFGLGGICRSAALLLRPGYPLVELVKAYEKRDQYGYWDARLKEGFHFTSTRATAQVRLRSARGFIRALQAELQRDSA